MTVNAHSASSYILLGHFMGQGSETHAIFCDCLLPVFVFE